MVQDSSGEPSQARRSRKLQVWLASAAAVVGIATGVFTLRDQLFPSGSGSTEETIPYFNDVVGHLEKSQDLVGFLQTHDGDAVRLEAGFQVALADYSVDEFGEPSEPGALPRITLYTECRPPLSREEREQFDLGLFRDEVIGRCFGDYLYVEDPDTEESGIYVTHGQPRIEGYFLVDIGDLQMGFTGITLTPISFQEATERT